VVLDVKKSPKGELTSVRLRILWLMDDGNVSMSVDQREVVFVNLVFKSPCNFPVFMLSPNSRKTSSLCRFHPCCRITHSQFGTHKGSLSRLFIATPWLEFGTCTR
jgi:hypothetical protein